jgi:hypothetical protein
MGTDALGAFPLLLAFVATTQKCIPQARSVGLSGYAEPDGRFCRCGEIYC